MHRPLRLPACAAAALLLGACASATPGTASSVPQSSAAKPPVGAPGSSARVDAVPEEAGPEDGVWRFSVAPYLWLFGMDGSISNGRRTVPVSSSVSDAVDLARDHLDFGLAGHFEASHGDWSLFLDANHLDFSGEKQASRQVAAVSGVATAELDADITISQVEIGAARRVGAFGVGGGRSAPVEVLGGARWNRLDVDLDLNTRVTAARSKFERAFAVGGTDDWTDPFIGLRAHLPLTDTVTLLARGDLGGGVGSGSDRAWNAILGLLVRCGESTEAFVGWRWYDFERDHSGRDTDLQLSGPGAGLVIHF